MKINKYYIVLAISIFIFGLKVSEDYGMHWDEGIQRFMGQEALVYVVSKLFPSQIKNIPNTLQGYSIEYSGRYGSVFDLPTAIIEELFFPDDLRRAYIMRHKVNWMFYFAGIIGFFFFSKLVFKTNQKAALATLFYILHPRLLAHGFFNPKDSILQSIVVLSLYPLAKAYFEKNWKWFTIAGIVMGLSISTRIVAIYIPFIFICFYSLKTLFTKKNTRFFISNNILNLLIFLIITFITVFLSWPILWENTVSNFIKIFSTMKQFPFTGNVFFFGEYIRARDVPWNYIPVWVGITTPILFLFLWVLGIGDLLKSIFKSWNKNIIWDGFMFAGFIVPLSAVIILKSTLYDSWRHMFFIYPFLAYFMAKGFFLLVEIINYKMKTRKNVIIIPLLVLIFSSPIYSIIRIHPYQQVYFNSIAGKDPMLNFEGDYLGLSYRKGFEWILENDSRDTINVIASQGWGNRHYLKSSDKKRLHLIYRDLPRNPKYDAGDYYITSFRGYQPDWFQNATNIPPFDNEVFSINIQGMKILGVYKLR